MGFAASMNGRIGIGPYWAYFIFHIVAILGLILTGVAMLFSGNWMAGILSFLAIIPVGLYFRVIMMRRCRDIGWPAWLPWAFFGANVMLSGIAFNGASSGIFSPGDIRSYLGHMNIISMLDLLFMIVIGCISPKQWSQPSYDPGIYPDAVCANPAIAYSAARESEILRSASMQSRPEPLQSEGISPDISRHDAAIAEALAAYKARSEAAQRNISADTAAPQQRPAMARTQAFGRKQL